MKKYLVLLVSGLLIVTAASGLAAKKGGTINIVGSTSVQPLAEELAQAYMSKNKNVKIFVQGGGSGAGIKAAMNGTAEIGMSSRELKPEEKSLKETEIAIDGIAVVVNKANSVTNLSFEELQKIYSGEINQWDQVKGQQQKMVVVNREAGSGTRGAFEEIILAPAKLSNTSNCLVQASTGAVQQTVAVTKEAIGYISLGAYDSKSVKALSLDGIVCTEVNIKAKKYKLMRPFLMLTKTSPQGVTKDFLAWILSAAGQKIVAKEFISVK